MRMRMRIIIIISRVRLTITMSLLMYNLLLLDHCYLGIRYLRHSVCMEALQALTKAGLVTRPWRRSA
ncbi:hypothetical protein N9L68_00055 [bacterium]|nr:hypothetical protein [bacterium]